MLQLLDDLTANGFDLAADEGGYGQVPMTNLLVPEQLFDRKYNRTYSTACRYHQNADERNRLNLYNEGIAADLRALKSARFPTGRNQTRVGRQEDFTRYYSQDELIYTSVDYNGFKVDTNNKSSTFGESYATRRRRTLFNLYAFTFSDSHQKNISSFGPANSKNAGQLQEEVELSMNY